MMLQKKPEYLESNTNIKKKADNIISEMSKYLNVKNIYCDKFMK